jgi:hypothetical protein
MRLQHRLRLAYSPKAERAAGMAEARLRVQEVRPRLAMAM